MKYRSCGVFASSAQSEVPAISSTVNTISSPSVNGGINDVAPDTADADGYTVPVPATADSDSQDYYSEIGTVDTDSYTVPVPAIADSDSPEQSLARDSNGNGQVGAPDAGGYLVPAPATADNILPSSPLPQQNECAEEIYAEVVYADMDAGT